MRFEINLCRVNEDGIITHMAGVPETADSPEAECTPETITWCPVDRRELPDEGGLVWRLRGAMKHFGWFNWNVPPVPTAAHPIDFDNLRQIMNPHGSGTHTCQLAGMARWFIECMLAFPRFETPGGVIELGGADYLTASETARRGKRKSPKPMDDFKLAGEMLADDERRECGFTRQVAAFNSYVDWVGAHAGCGRAAQGVVIAVDRLAECLRECGIRETAHIERAAADVISALAELCRALGEAESGLTNFDGGNSALVRIDENTRELPTMKAGIDGLYALHDKGNPEPPLNETARAAIVKMWKAFKAGELDAQVDGEIGKRTCQSFIDWCANLTAYTKPGGAIMTVNDCLPGGEEQLKKLLRTENQKRYAAK